MHKNNSGNIKLKTHLLLSDKDSQKIVNIPSKFKITLEEPAAKVIQGMKEICLHTDNHFDAINYTSILIAAQSVLQMATIGVNIFERFNYPYADIKKIFLEYNNSQDYMQLTQSVCCFEIASKAWKDERAFFALEKLLLSYELASCHYFAYDPNYNSDLYGKEHPNKYYIKAAISILTAYSVIEELNIKIKKIDGERFNNDRSSFIPAVRDDINRQLKEIGITENDKVAWMIRGEKSDLEKNLNNFNGKELYPYKKNIHDIELSIPQAIYYCLKLRNKTAHDLKGLEFKLGPYLVSNVQEVVRFLLLKYLKMWDII